MASAISGQAPLAQVFRKVELDLSTTRSLSPTFDPALHLAYKAPTTSHSLESLGLSSPKAISPVGVTAPFPLFSAAGIKALRADIFRPSILAKHKRVDPRYPGCYKLRGIGRDAPFVYSTFSHPTLVDACSKAAGCELEVVFEYEMAHVNVQLEPGMVERGEDLPAPEPPLQTAATATLSVEGLKEGDLQVSSWHSDSYPWVCVCMLSDPTGMVGGETAIRTGSGEIVKIRGPQMGYAVMMQGGLIPHAALKALGTGERITLVTSFRPRDPFAYDASHLGNVKHSSDLTELFRDWTVYRAEVMSKRAEALAKKIRDGGLTGEQVFQLTREWTEEQIKYSIYTVNEMTDEGTKPIRY